MDKPHIGQDKSALNGDQRPAHTSLILVGRAGSGKSTVGPILAQRTGFPLLEIGEIVRRQAAQYGRSALEHAHQTFAQGQHAEFVAAAVSEAKSLGLPCIVSGPRRPDELQYLRAQLHPTVAIALSVSDAERDWRLDKRDQQADRNHRDVIEESWGIGLAIDACDFLVLSYGQPEAVAAQCLALWMTADRQLGEE